MADKDIIKNNNIKFNTFSFLSTFSRTLIEVFISLYLFKNGCSVKVVLLFYFLVNIFSMPLSYLFVYIGEKTKYSLVMIIGIVAFILVQVFLWNIKITIPYIFLIALLYSIYRRGYWVSRRFYITKIMPPKETSGLFSIILVFSQIATIISSYLGANILENLNLFTLTTISVSILLISTVPLFFIKYDKNKNLKIELLKNVKKIPKKNLLVFSFYELNNLISFLFPIYIAIYIKDTYSLAGGLNIVNNIAVILFVIIYGKIINKKHNYLIVSTILLSCCTLLKLSTNAYFITIIYFIEGFISKMQNQSVTKIYFEERNIDLVHYNLIYQINECFIRAIVIIPLLFISEIKYMLLITEFVIIIMLLIYVILIKTKNRIILDSKTRKIKQDKK